jgi:hypothetical protein
MIGVVHLTGTFRFLKNEPKCKSCQQTAEENCAHRGIIFRNGKDDGNGQEDQENDPANANGMRKIFVFHVHTLFKNSTGACFIE